MTIFYIDTTSNYLYTGLVKDDVLINERKENLDHDLSTFALDEVNNMFLESKLKPIDIDKIIVVNGPGSFTGIRIGVTIAKVFAWSLKKDITTISSLEACNASYNFDGLVVPVINARRSSVYGAIYENGNVLLEEQYMTIEKLLLELKKLNKDYVFVSNDKFKEIEVCNYTPDILKIVETYKYRECINPHIVNPNYLKLTEAEENKMKEE